MAAEGTPILACVHGPQVLAAIRKGTVLNPGGEGLVAKRERTAEELTAILKVKYAAEHTIFILTGAEVALLLQRCVRAWRWTVV